MAFTFVSDEAGVEPSSDALAARTKELPAAVDAALEHVAVDDALRAIFAVVAEANVHLVRTAPWAIVEPPLLHAALGATFEAIEAVAGALVPFLPTTSERIAAALATPDEPAQLLFPKEGVIP